MTRNSIGDQTYCATRSKSTKSVLQLESTSAIPAESDFIIWRHSELIRRQLTANPCLELQNVHGMMKQVNLFLVYVNVYLLHTKDAKTYFFVKGLNSMQING